MLLKQLLSLKICLNCFFTLSGKFKKLKLSFQYVKKLNSSLHKKYFFVMEVN